MNVVRPEEGCVVGRVGVTDITSCRGDDMGGQLACRDDAVVAGRTGAGWIAVRVACPEEGRVIGCVGVA